MSVWERQQANEVFGIREARRVAGKISNDKPSMFIGGAMYFDLDGHNAIIEQWASKVRTALKQSASWFEGKDEPFVMRGIKTGDQHREGKLAQSIVSKTRKEFGAIDRLTFNFERHGVFVHKGVGRGYVSRNGFVTRISKTEPHKPRVAVEWFNPVLNRLLPELANRLAELNADIAINADRMFIK